MLFFHFVFTILLYVQAYVQKIIPSWNRSLSSSMYSESGQGLAEYAFILSLVSIVGVVVLSLVGEQVRLVFDQILCLFVDSGAH